MPQAMALENGSALVNSGQSFQLSTPSLVGSRDGLDGTLPMALPQLPSEAVVRAEVNSGMRGAMPTADEKGKSRLRSGLDMYLEQKAVSSSVAVPLTGLRPATLLELEQQRAEAHALLCREEQIARNALAAHLVPAEVTMLVQLQERIRMIVQREEARAFDLLTRAQPRMRALIEASTWAQSGPAGPSETSQVVDVAAVNRRQREAAVMQQEAYILQRRQWHIPSHWNRPGRPYLEPGRVDSMADTMASLKDVAWVAQLPPETEVMEARGYRAVAVAQFPSMPCWLQCLVNLAGPDRLDRVQAAVDSVYPAHMLTEADITEVMRMLKHLNLPVRLVAHMPVSATRREYLPHTLLTITDCTGDAMIMLYTGDLGTGMGHYQLARLCVPKTANERMHRAHEEQTPAQRLAAIHAIARDAEKIVTDERLPGGEACMLCQEPAPLSLHCHLGEAESRHSAHPLCEQTMLWEELRRALVGMRYGERATWQQRQRCMQCVPICTNTLQGGAGRAPAGPPQSAERRVATRNETRPRLEARTPSTRVDARQGQTRARPVAAAPVEVTAVAEMPAAFGPRVESSTHVLAVPAVTPAQMPTLAPVVVARTGPPPMVPATQIVMVQVSITRPPGLLPTPVYQGRAPPARLLPTPISTDPFAGTIGGILPGPSVGPQPEDLGVASWDEVVIVTPTYLPAFPQVHQCLTFGGSAQRDVNQAYPGPVCRCQLGGWHRLGFCAHVVKAVLRRRVILVSGWRLEQYRRFQFWYSRVYQLVPRSGQAAARSGDLYFVARPDAPGDEPEALFPAPGLESVERNGESFPMALRPMGTQWTAARVEVSWTSLFANLSRPLQTVRGALGVCGAFAAGLALNLSIFASGLLSSIFASCHLGWVVWLCGLLLKGAVAALVLAHLPALLAALIVGLILLLLKLLVARWLLRSTQSGAAGQVLFGLTGPVSMALSVTELFLEPQAIVSYAPRPTPQMLIYVGPGAPQMALEQEVINRVCARGIHGTDLVAPLLASVAAQQDYPSIPEGMRLAERVRIVVPPTAVTAEVAQPLGLRGAGIGPVCQACGCPMGRGRKQRRYHLCQRCYAAATHQRDQPVHPRHEIIQSEGIPVTERCPIMPIESEYLPPPQVEQRTEWETVKTSFRRVHEAVVREQNRRRRAIVVGVAHPQHMPGVFPRGPESMYNGLRCRTYRQVPCAKPLAYLAMGKVAESIFNNVPSGVVQQMDLETWFAHQEREQEMRAAWALYQTEGLTAEDLVCKPFVKSEFHYMGAAKGNGVMRKREGKPRPIYTLSDKTQVIVGRWTLPLMKFFQRHLSLGNVIQYCGCNTPQQNHAVLQEIVECVGGGARIWLNDFTCFETTQNRRTMGIVRTLYRRVWEQADPLREQAMDSWEAPRFKARSGGFKFSGQLPEMMCSGRSDTAITNSLLNAIATATAHAAARLGVKVAELLDRPDLSVLALLSEYRMYFVGDDSVVVGPEPDAGYTQRVQEAYGDMGFNCKLERKEHIRDIVFLANRPYNVRRTDGRRQWCWGPTLGRRLYKHHCALDLDSNPMDWLAQVTQMEVTNYGHVPILGPLARRVQQLLPHVARPLKKKDQEKLDTAMEYHMATETMGWSDYQTLQELAPVYKVSPEDLRLLEQQFLAITAVPCWLSSPVLDRIMLTDN